MIKSSLRGLIWTGKRGSEKLSRPFAGRWCAAIVSNDYRCEPRLRCLLSLMTEKPNLHMTATSPIRWCPLWGNYVGKWICGRHRIHRPESTRTFPAKNIRGSLKWPGYLANIAKHFGVPESRSTTTCGICPFIISRGMGICSRYDLKTAV